MAGVGLKNKIYLEECLLSFTLIPLNSKGYSYASSTFGSVYHFEKTVVEDVTSFDNVYCDMATYDG
jgi:hypothetical protein